MTGQRHVGDDHISNLLAGIVRLVDGAVAAAFVPQLATDSPIVWATSASAILAGALSATAAEHLEHGGPWGAVGDTPPADPAPNSWTAWVEPVPRVDDGQPRDGAEEDDAPVGALAVARQGRSGPLNDEDVETIHLFARLCAGATRASQQTGELAHQRRVDDLVSQISERLMSTTLPTLQATLDWTIETLCRFLGADAAFLRRNDHAGGVSVLMAEYPRREIALEEDPLGVVPFDADPMFSATRDLKVPLIMRDPSTVDEQYAARVEEGTGGLANFTGAGVPLLHGGVTEGCIAFIYLADLDWTEHEVNALRAVAALLVQLLERVNAEERLRHSALTDDLTGLANRRALLTELTRRSGTSAPLALLFLDLDRFKIMNDHLGHRAGDRVLQVVADRIRTSLRPTDFAARLGGDEFVVLIEDSAGGLGAVAAAQRLLEAVAAPIEVGGQSVTHTSCIGIAVSDEETSAGEALLGRADIALHAAKLQGRNQTVVFDHNLEATVTKRAGTELLLRQALSNEAFRLYYQPEFDLRTGRMLAVEALVRWERPGHGIIGAAEFIPVAEETHLITDIDCWVLGEACNQMARWRRAFPDLDLVVRVNMSPGQLALAGMVQTVAQSLRRSGLPPDRLCLEITERAMIADVDQAVQVLRDVRALGVTVAIDDFGTGFSSMIQLKNLPVDTIKIDRVFVDGIATDPTDQAIVDSIVRLADAFHLHVVAEGVETIADLETLRLLRCHRAQGFLLSSPLPASEVEALVRRGEIDLASLRNAASAGRRDR